MTDDKKKLEEKNEEIDSSKNTSEEKKVEGSGIFTTDGKELPKIKGGYDIIGADSGLGDNDFEG